MPAVQNALQAHFDAVVISGSTLFAVVFSVMVFVQLVAILIYAGIRKLNEHEERAELVKHSMHAAFVEAVNTERQQQPHSPFRSPRRPEPEEALNHRVVSLQTDAAAKSQLSESSITV
jgi:hypothetical protein